MPNFFFGENVGLPEVMNRVIFADMYETIHLGTWGHFLFSTQAYQFDFRELTGLQNAEIDYKVYAEKGSKTLTFLLIKSIAGGIMHIYLDGEFQGTIDLYSDTPVWNGIATLGLTVLTTGVHVLKIKMETKNPDSNSYYCTFTWLRID